MADNIIIEENREAVIQALDAYLSKFPTRDKAAEDLGVSRVYVWKMRDGIKPISEAVLARLGFKMEVKKIKTYIPIEENNNGN